MNSQTNSLKMLTREETSKLLNTSLNTLDMLREVGVLKAIKIGKNYMYSQFAIKQFQLDYEGYELSNLITITNSYKQVSTLEKGKN